MIDRSPSVSRRTPPKAVLSPTCTNDELLAWVKQHYFSGEELAEAQRILEASGYEEAIAYLAQVGQDSMRFSEVKPHLFLTIPGGKLLVFHPGRSEGSMTRTFSFGIAEFARLVFPLLPGSRSCIARPTQPLHGLPALWDEFAVSELPDSIANEPAHSVKKQAGTRAKKLKYDEQTARVGSGSCWIAKKGWVMRDRGLADVIEPMGRGGYDVSIVHVRSYQVMASLFIPRVDELAHIRLRQLLEVVVTLTDWTQGIKAILQEKQGPQKQTQWAAQILDIWWKQERTTLFALYEERPLPLELCEISPT